MNIKDARDEHESKKLNWRDAVGIVVRRRWWLAGPFLAIGLAGSLVARYWPEVFQSQAVIMVEQQRVPTQYVTPNVVASMQDRLNNMTQQIFSRTRLKALIEQYSLYPKQRAHKTMDEVIDKMRDDIHVEVIQSPANNGDVTSFTLSYSAHNPRVAQQIASQLTSMFIEENLQDLAQQSTETTSFLESQLEDARKNLADQEDRMQQYKTQFLGQLPEQEQSNLQIMGSLEAQLQGANNELERADQEKTYLQSLQTGYKTMQTPPAAAAAGAPTVPGHYSNPDEALRDLRAQLVDLQSKYSPKHPDVIAMKDQIAMWEARKRALAAEKPASGATSHEADNPGLVDIDSRLKAVTAEEQARRRDVAQIQKTIQGYEGRLNMTPVREQQLAEVTRNYENARALYQSLLQKMQQSELATNLEKRQEGQRFRLVDAPILPEEPIEPNRLQIVLAGWLSGLCLAIGLTITREFVDETIRSEEDLKLCTPLPVLVRVPILRSPTAERYYRRHQVFEFAGAMLLLVLSVGAGIYTCLVT